MKSAAYWIEKLNLNKHPEGGWYREIYRSQDVVSKACITDSFSGDRNFCTSIYYLLKDTDFSAFHRIKSDEIWHFYTGDSPVEILIIENSELRKELLGSNPENGESLQVVVPKNCWFAARLYKTFGFALSGCTVSPGFDFEDFEMGDEKLAEEFPEFESEIRILLRH